MTIITVSQLNRYIKAVLEESAKLSDLYVKGEISNFTRHFKSGHCYFSLKDETGTISAVMFRNYAEGMRFEPENGLTVIARASVGVYERSGSYQLYVTDMQPDGVGAEALRFEQLKRNLAKRGLFDEWHKKPLPAFPARIGVVTSVSGAALQDIKSVISRRFPLCTLVVCDAQVQGVKAPELLVRALNHLDSRGKCDVIIIGRGGGSAEDLSAFNDENLACAIFAAKTPVVSAVGHEVDYTICDFVADVRAATPSAAAELVTPSVDAIYRKLGDTREFFAQTAAYTLEEKAAVLARLRKNPRIASPMAYVLKNQQRLDFLSQSLYNKKRLDLKRFEDAISSRAALMESLSPLGVLARGYCAAFREGKAVLSSAGLKIGDGLDLRFGDGEVKARVLEVHSLNEKKS